MSWQAARLLPANVQVFDVEFGAGSTDPKEWADKRTELHWLLREWLQGDGALEPCEETQEELLAAADSFANGRGPAIRLEKQDGIKARLGRSPDRVDALPLAVAGHVGKVRQRGAVTVHWV